MVLTEDALSTATARLRKTSIDQRRDLSAPKLTGYLAESQVSEYQTSVLDANIESWVDLLGPLTYETKLIELTMNDARVILDHWDKSIVTMDDALQQLEPLRRKLQREIDSTTQASKHSGVFVKTSSRSAKDCPAAFAALGDVYRQKIASAKEAKAAAAVSATEGANNDLEDKLCVDVDENTKLWLLIEAGMSMMKVNTAKQALEMLLKSERIAQDMRLALDPKHAQRWCEHVVVREWVPMDVDMEFRAFVKGNVMTALSQYNHFVFSQRLLDGKAAIERRILDFFHQRVLPRLVGSALSDYVIDFSVTGKELDTIHVVELNPFLQTTDAALFSWSKEENLLCNGPFEFRVCQAPRHGAKSLLDPIWRSVFDQTSTT